MEIKILQHLQEVSQKYPPRKGSIKVEVGGKQTLWFELLQSKAGAYFCRPCQAYIGGGFKPVFDLIDEVKMKELCNEVAEMAMRNG